MHLTQRCHVHRLSRHLHAKKKVVRVLKDICLHASYAKAPCPPAQLTPTRKKKVVLVLKEICLHASYAKKRLCLCLSKIIVYMHVWNLVTGDFWWANGAMPTGSADKQMLVLVFIG